MNDIFADIISQSVSSDAIEDDVDIKNNTRNRWSIQQIILNVNNNLKSENYGTKTETIVSVLSLTIVRTSKLTGVSYGTVQKIVQNSLFKKRTRKDKGQSRKISMRDFDIMRRDRFYKENEGHCEVCATS